MKKGGLNSTVCDYSQRIICQQILIRNIKVRDIKVIVIYVKEIFDFLDS